jgi:hypothetical protein
MRCRQRKTICAQSTVADLPLQGPNSVHALHHCFTFDNKKNRLTERGSLAEQISRPPVATKSTARR